MPMLSSIKGTAHLGEVLLIGIEAPDALWFTSERGKERRVIAGGLSSAQVTVSDQPMTAVAWENRGTIWASRQCAP